MAGALAPWYLNGCLRQSRLAGVPCILRTVDGGQDRSVQGLVQEGFMIWGRVQEVQCEEAQVHVWVVFCVMFCK